MFRFKYLTLAMISLQSIFAMSQPIVHEVLCSVDGLLIRIGNHTEQPASCPCRQGSCSIDAICFSRTSGAGEIESSDLQISITSSEKVPKKCCDGPCVAKLFDDVSGSLLSSDFELLKFASSHFLSRMERAAYLSMQLASTRAPPMI